MRREEYIKIQLQSSEWTRQNPNSMALVQDSIQEFCKYVPLNYYILEIGCGDGYSLDLLKAKGYRKLIGCDINLTKLKTASSFGHIVVVQDAHSLGFRSEVFDAVYCTHTLEHMYDGYQALHEIFRVLRPGGLLFVIVPDHEPLYGDTYVEPQQVVPLGERPLLYFEDILFRRKGIRSPTPRNQFPFTMKLLLATLIKTGFDIHCVARIARNGPELWALATKPDPNKNYIEPLISRIWLNYPSLFKINILKKIQKIERHTLKVLISIVSSLFGKGRLWHF